MRKYGIWHMKQKIMLTDFDITDYRKRIWNLEKWFTKYYGGGQTLSVGGQCPFGGYKLRPINAKGCQMCG